MKLLILIVAVAVSQTARGGEPVAECTARLVRGHVIAQVPQSPSGVSEWKRAVDAFCKVGEGNPTAVEEIAACLETVGIAVTQELGTRKLTRDGDARALSSISDLQMQCMRAPVFRRDIDAMLVCAKRALSVQGHGLFDWTLAPDDEDGRPMYNPEPYTTVRERCATAEKRAFQDQVVGCVGDKASPEAYASCYSQIAARESASKERKGSEHRAVYEKGKSGAAEPDLAPSSKDTRDAGSAGSP